MSVFTTKENWNIATGKLKQNFAPPAYEGLQFNNGKEDELNERIQRRTGQPKFSSVRGCGWTFPFPPIRK